MALVIGTTFPRILTYFPESIASHLFNAGRNVRLSIPFCVGYALVLAGATIRVLCYRRLRDRFTFDLAIRKDHALETGGMYSVVRHPAYIGSLLFIGGTYICTCDGQSLLAAFGVWETSWGRAFHSFMVGSALLAVYVFVDRTHVEDRALQQQFGEQWVTWARRTPYKLIPFVF
ncbi:hypothetical protein PHLGIDRAFT_78613 [Phlebiopsis gigantea 11061_1 CR5-6]|uniref:Protein-S-isoprenylcysteine O-methyltransferase n=1 Tax=Phlebiopsis gigantea (strain 11061_1 CR5-6) TaxID=745531 RepID=A0A0C3S113_PHLG1|nr:hypothetical protein PHLGIDRAFT_78613 [Phlebiopsis gigantea 11061_1 CR5-6]